MKKYFKEFSENIAIITLCFYILGFLYQYWFYKYFGIEIQYYINLTDLIFISIFNILVTLSLFVLWEVMIHALSKIILLICCYFINRSKLRNRSGAFIMKFYALYLRKIIYENLTTVGIALYFLVILGLIPAVLFNRPLSLFFIFFSLLPGLIFRLYLSMKVPGDQFEKSNRNFFKSLVFLILAVFYSFWGFKSAVEISENATSKIIRTGNIYTGDGINKFIGETSSHYFILDTKSNKVIILNKGNLDNVIIEETNFLHRNEARDFLNYYLPDLLKQF